MATQEAEPPDHYEMAREAKEGHMIGAITDWEYKFPVGCLNWDVPTAKQYVVLERIATKLRGFGWDG
jgi:hypothetical protein